VTTIEGTAQASERNVNKERFDIHQHVSKLLANVRTRASELRHDRIFGDVRTNCRQGEANSRNSKR
jgi:hypothetical protein